MGLYLFVHSFLLWKTHTQKKHMKISNTKRFDANFQNRNIKIKVNMNKIKHEKFNFLGWHWPIESSNKLIHTYVFIGRILKSDININQLSK